MEKAEFLINDKSYQVSISGAPPFSYGKNELLSTRETDISYGQEWYEQGFKAISFLNESEFLNLKVGLAASIQKIISSVLERDIANFELREYHNIVKSDDDHYKVVSKTRDLFSSDFNFPITDMIPRFEKLLGFGLTDVNPFDGAKLHIIVRINRPFSSDFNPPHKDIYEDVDTKSYIPQLINLWIPISGVTQKSSLPVVPYSHLLTEDKIFRTIEGGVVEGHTYRVRMVKSWGGSNKMIRPAVNYGEVLFFSSHLVHGLAINEEVNQTRVALEFRLFKRSN